ncbi:MULTISPECIES: hypothetical protein [unclassified Acinetobacter]|uniref:hypothetical protein n=1 Tax=unclassified Acinetobacter TaxID=196816 RepID=UPI002575A3D5|nr:MULTISPECIES: hypothetical protein [unclassified Acinetobacter]MDM1766084.1 hypothetical protein [Acinetobacter sp. 226-1]MDM1769854.1 hypothetical protein [Acinetobacter sp. 226-4]
MDKQMTFDEYCKKNQHSRNCTRLEAFSMGQQSRQVEIDEKDKLIKELKDSVATYKIETYESHRRISYAHHCFMNMDRDQFYKNIEAVICGRLRHPEFSFDRSRIKALRGERE